MRLPARQLGQAMLGIRSPLGGATLVLRRYVRDWLARPHPAPLFVLGNQKSGTTAVAALVAAASGRRLSSDLLFHRDFPDYAEVVAGRVPVAEIIRRARHDFSAGVIKDPEFTFRAAALAEAFPAARFLLVVRHPAQNIRSILDRLGLPGDREDLGADALAAAGVPRTWQTLFDPAPLGLEPGTYIELLARRWVRSVSPFPAAGRDGEPRLEILRYEGFRKDKAGTIAQAARNTGLPADRAIDHLVDIAYQPSYASEHSLERFFGARNLERIWRICSPAAASFGYTPSAMPNGDLP